MDVAIGKTLEGAEILVNLAIDDIAALVNASSFEETSVGTDVTGEKHCV